MTIFGIKVGQGVTTYSWQPGINPGFGGLGFVVCLCLCVLPKYEKISLFEFLIITFANKCLKEICFKFACF